MDPDSAASSQRPHATSDPRARRAFRERDLPYARVADVTLLARVVAPASSPEGPPAPCLVDVHGGAWTRFDRTLGTRYQRALAASGVVVVALDFRQGPVHRYPAACADVAAGLRWVRAHARELGVDPDRLGMIGSSSGGQIALEVALQPGARQHAGPAVLGLDGQELDPSAAAALDAPVRCVLALFPVSDPLDRYRYVREREHEPPDLRAGFDPRGLVAAHRAYFGSEISMRAASIPRILGSGEAKALPRLWVAQPELDQNVPVRMTERLVEAYRAAGGSAEWELFAGEHHGFVYRDRPAGARCIERMRALSARWLAPAAEI